MEDIISKDIVKKLMNINGMVRGMAIKSHGDFVLKEKGRQDLEELERMMAEFGCPINHKKLQTWEFYPIGVEIVELLAIKKLFGFEDEKFEEIGSFESMSSLLIKVFLKYFTSFKTVAEQAPSIWKKYYTVGSLRIGEVNERERYAVLILENFKVHPLHCFHLKGYFASVLKMVVGSKVSCQETKCPFNGDSYHEFLLKW